MDFAKFSGSESQILEKSQNEKVIKKNENFQKHEHFGGFDDFRDWLGHALQVGGVGPPDNSVTKNETRFLKTLLSGVGAMF